MFSHCSIDVKIVLFNSYCIPLYCSYLWTEYKKTYFIKKFEQLLITRTDVYLVSQIQTVQVQCMQIIIYVISRIFLIISYND